MPLYEYECRRCGHRFEALVLPTSAAPECPACQGGDLEQLISLFGVSSESTRQASLGAQNQKHAREYKDFQHEDKRRRDQHTD